ncbi:MAG TPA: hypothetical protein VFB50_13610 [Chloroflexota bacterium]|nr:hypothetical protein [Chloroflexota bacterium]
MKRILLKSLPDPRDPTNRIDYRELVEQVVRVPLNRQTGATIDEMRRSIRVLDALEAAEQDVLTLEDSDWQILKEKVEAFPWGMVDRRLLEFYDDVTSATDAVRQGALANGRL